MTAEYRILIENSGGTIAIGRSFQVRDQAVKEMTQLREIAVARGVDDRYKLQSREIRTEIDDWKDEIEEPGPTDPYLWESGT